MFTGIEIPSKEEVAAGSEGRKALHRVPEASAVAEMLSIWPKIVEYTGLSQHEAKVYLCLVSLGGASARRLSLYCDVPRTKIYEMLYRLIDFGLVREISGNPKLFTPASPDNAFSVFLNIMRRRAADFGSLIQALSEVHTASMTGARVLEKRILYLDGAEDVSKKCLEVLKGTLGGVTVLTCADGLSILFNLAHKLLDELHERGVGVRLLSPLNPRTNPLARELSYIFDVEEVGFERPVLLVESDGERLFLARVSEDGDQGRLDSAIYSDDRELLSLLSLLLVHRDSPHRGKEAAPVASIVDDAPSTRGGP